MDVPQMSEDLTRLLDAIADVERAERKLAVEVAAFHAVYDKMHPDDVPRWLRAVAFSAHAIMARANN